MIGTIRKHTTWLWGLIIAATIISFIYAFNPATRNGALRDSSGAVYNFGSINGEPITMQQMREASAEARIFMRLNSRQWPEGNAHDKEIEQIARQRLMLNAEMAEYHISATPEAAARYTKQLLGINPDENVPADKIIETLSKLAQEGHVSVEDFDRFIRHQVGQEYLVAIVGMSGKLITPKEAEIFFRRENEPIETELVTFPAANYMSDIHPSDKEIEDFYTKRAADYRVPDRIVVNYVPFLASDFTAKAEKLLGTNLDAQVEQAYLQSGAGAFKDDAGNQMTAEAAKAKIKKGYVRYAAMGEARKAAYAFLNQMSQGKDDQHPYTVDDLFTTAKTNSMTVKTTEPFDLTDAPKDLPLGERELRILFSLRSDDPDDKDHSMLYSMSPLEGPDGFYVVGLKSRIPSQVQPFDAVKDKVVADYKETQALDKAKSAGSRFQSTLEAGMAQGKTFDTMCAANFVHPIKLKPFSLMSTNISEVTNKVDAEQIQELAGRMQPGQATPFVPTPEGGFILYEKARLPVDESLIKSELPVYVERMRDRLQIAAFQEWFGRQYQLHFTPPPGDTPAAGG